MGLPKLADRQDTVAIGVLLPHGLCNCDRQDGLARLGVEERGQFSVVEEPVAVDVCCLELCRLDLLPVLQLLHLLLVATIGLVVDVVQVLFERQLPVLRGVDLLNDRADILARDGLANRLRKPHDLLQRHPAVAVAVHQLVQPAQLLSGEGLLLDVVFLSLLSGLLAVHGGGQKCEQQEDHPRGLHRRWLSCARAAGAGGRERMAAEPQGA
mmetsp:Transcript_22278/g.66915  ORF Transcript_22278/g.66915 Transcript_22278/m.66915 type:complete len:211 (+) Transcript_22278:507-1139(+)